jgi:hypothetical protein
MRSVTKRVMSTIVPLVLAVAGMALAAPATQARSTTPDVFGVQDVAGKSPFIGRDCNVATPYYTQPGGKEGEPSIAVNPARPSNRIATWMDATRATVNTAYTTDGGRTWTLSIPQGIDGCTGNQRNDWEASGDPWLTFGPDGTAYLSTLTWAHFVTPPATGYVSVIHVQTSDDGGRTWSEPVTLGGQRAVSDKPVVLADPNHAGVAYEIWRNQSFGLPVGDRGTTLLLFAKTTDGGATWSRPVHIDEGTPADFFGSPQISVLRDGRLVATSSLANPAGGTDLLAWRSGNHGHTWSGPVVIRNAPAGGTAPICDLFTAGADASSSSGQQTVDGNAVVFVSLDGPAATAGGGAIILSRSTDGGATWTNRTIVRSDRPLLLASIASGKAGRLGLVWDEIDTAGVDCATAAIPTRTRFAASWNGRNGWSGAVTVGARWWNLASGTRGTGGFSGYFIGDYQSLASIPAGFTTITVQGEVLTGAGQAPSITGATEVMVAKIRL